jgi:cytochrome P450
MKRRTFLQLGAVGAAGAAAGPGLAHYQSANPSQSLDDLGATITRLRNQFLANFDAAYVDRVIVPYFLLSMYQGERPPLPMIDVTLTKENALPYDLWGMLSENWRPNPEDGVTVFLQALENRGPDNRRKRIYMSALTPDLYRPMYGQKVAQFFDKLLDEKNADRPLMRPYLTAYWDLYWDLHLGVKGDAIPQRVRQIGDSFNTVLAYRDPTQRVVYDNYMIVRSELPFLKSWIDRMADDLKAGRTPNPEKTFAYYWIKNGGENDHFRHKDVVFECFHNFVAFSQWGNTLYNIMLKLGRNSGDPEVQASFRRTMEGSFDQAGGAAFTPLEGFVMELFRTISPNGGSISALRETRNPPFPRNGYILTPHTATSMDPRHWEQPEKFDPTRYNGVPTSHDIDETRARRLGFARCPFERERFQVKDGRKATLNNSAFGTVYGVVNDKPMPVCDYAGFAPFGFGYRRCPGEQLTINVFEDFLRKVWKERIEFVKLNIASPELVPIGPTTVIGDNVGFVRPA